MLYKTIDNLPISFCIIKNNYIVDCNLNTVNLFGYESKADIIGLKPFDLSPYLQDDGLLSTAKGQEYIKKAHKDKIMNFTWRHAKKNGDTFLAYINLIGIGDSVFVLITNLDELRDIEDAFKKKDQMYQLLFEENQNMIYIIDAETKEITETNQAAADFYGYPINELRKKKIYDLYLNEKENVDKHINSVLMNEKNFFYDKHILANGEIRDVEINCFSFTLDKKEYLMNMVTDKTEKMKQNLIIKTFLTQSPYPIAILDNEQHVININDKFTDLFQYTKAEVLGKNLNDLVTTMEYRDELHLNINELFSVNFIHKKTIRKRKDNTLVNVEIVAFPIMYNEQIIGAYVHYIDITEKIRVQNQLEVFKKVLENNDEGIIITDTNGHIEWVNQAFTKITGYTIDEIMGNTPRILKSNIQGGSFYKNMWSHILKNDHWHGEIWNKNKKGEIYPEWLNIYALKNNQITTNYVGIFKDLSERKVIDQKMRILAQKDVLTGLYNRVYFTEHLNDIIHKKEAYTSAVFFIDLNHFKEINDTLGHQAGDQFLIELSRRLLNTLNDDALIARYGGDEFVLLLTGCKNKQQITRVAKNILSVISKPFMYNGNYLHTSASLGITIYPKDGATSEELIQNADIAMYVAKNNVDRKMMYYSTTMRKEINERFRIANLLRDAIQNKDYTLLYEPIFDLNTNQIISAEMKLDWHNRQLKEYAPEKSIQIAIQTGLINEIFDIMFNEICTKLSLSQNFLIPISLNISIEQLEQTQFLSHIKEQIKKYHVKPKNIEFEFADNNLKKHSSRVNKNIRDLLKIGFNFTLDNFGQENSSIAQLKHYQIKKIKLSKNIIHTIETDAINYELVKLYRLISQEMNIYLIAKGIHQQKQLELMKKLNLNGGQGYYYSKPITFEQLNELLKQKS